ncbi:MAG: hypothetical protein RI988_2359 [Pseudomonadota bacterium]|jgi:uncharacterized protein (TIGR00369 family)
MDFPVEIPFGRLLGLELVEVGLGSAVLAVQLRPELTNSFQVAHGGVTMALLDVAMAHAARSPLAEGGPWMPGVVTIEMKTSFLLPGEGRLVATARCLRRTASLAFCEAGIAREDGELAAHATGTFKFLRGLPAGSGGRDVRRPGVPAGAAPSPHRTDTP